MTFMKVDSRYFDVSADLLEHGGCENDRNEAASRCETTISVKYKCL